MNTEETVIIGAGMTGLAAGITSGFTVYESASRPGGICSSYYMAPNTEKRIYNNPNPNNTYRFEIGGGHWLHSGDKMILEFIKSFVNIREYSRTSKVYLPSKNKKIPFPIQYNTRYLDENTRYSILSEIKNGMSENYQDLTMEEWFEKRFGKTLSKLFFHPFHDLYTAGLSDKIAAPSDGKTPVDLNKIIKGAFKNTAEVGYNTTFVYPHQGLDVLSKNMAKKCRVKFTHRVVNIDTGKKVIEFENGKRLNYKRVISTVPLNKIVDIADIDTEEKKDPYVSVLVINIGGKAGNKAPSEDWLYIPKSESGFHRVGFYSNVDSSFVPKSKNHEKDLKSIYVEKAFMGGDKPTRQEIDNLCTSVCEELREWGWIDSVDVVDPTWIDVAYTWTYPGSSWRTEAIRALEENGIYQAGRYATWASGWQAQGITASLREGIRKGATLKEMR